MSRIRRLKREKIKATISGLALMIAIGTAGGVGSYAWFSDQAEAKNDLVVTMGSLSTGMLNPINIVIDDEETDECTDEENKQFTIKNTGSLKQNVAIMFSITPEDSQSVGNLPLDSVGCTLRMEYKGNEVKLGGGNQISNLKQLFSTESRTIVDQNGYPIQLNPEEWVLCTLDMNIKQGTSDKILEVLDDQNINFNINAESIQINSEGGSN